MADASVARAPSRGEGEESARGAVDGAPVDPIATTNQYTAEFQATIEGLRQRGVAIQETIQQQIASGSSAIEPLKQDLLNTLQDLSGEVSTPPARVFQTFAWTSVLVLGASISFYIGANLLGGLVHMFVGAVAMGAIGLVAVPGYAYYSIKNFQNPEQADATIRFSLLGCAALSGLVLGAGYNATYYWAEPIAFLTPLTIALVFAYGQPSLGNNKQTLLGAAVGGGLAIHLLVGSFAGSLSPSYLTLAALYSAAAFATLQLLFKNVTSEDAQTHLYMLTYLTAYLAAKSISFFVFGTSEPYEPPQEEDK